MDRGFPHVTGSENRPGVLYDLGIIRGSPWYKPKHRRRGRLVDAACGLLATGNAIDPDWWKGSSGHYDPPRNDDLVYHEECRPYIDAFRRVLAVHNLGITAVQVEVLHLTLQYQGRADLVSQDCVYDVKCGEPAPWHVLQLMAYNDALAQMYGHGYRAANIYLPSGKVVEHLDPQHLLAWRRLVRCWWDIKAYSTTT